MVNMGVRETSCTMQTGTYRSWQDVMESTYRLDGFICVVTRSVVTGSLAFC